MAKEPKTPTETVKPESEKPKENLASLDLDDFDASSDEDLSLSLEDEIETKKMATRRKIEMYWEKKRLRDELGEFEETDLDF
jgi:hypothetical protein